MSAEVLVRDVAAAVAHQQPVADEEAEGTDPVAEVHEQVAGLLSGPRAVQVVSHPRMCTRRVATSMTNSTYSRLSMTVSRVKKSHASRRSA
jgi:hypothetical protein